MQKEEIRRRRFIPIRDIITGLYLFQQCSSFFLLVRTLIVRTLAYRSTSVVEYGFECVGNTPAVASYSRI